jgi:hypothetical protein
MRKNPETIEVKATQTDAGAPEGELRGPFKGTLKAKLWASERWLSQEDFAIHTKRHLVTSLGTVIAVAPYTEPVVFTISETETTTWGQKVAWTRGITAELGLPNVAKAGVKADVQVELNHSWAIAKATTLSFALHPTPGQTGIQFYKAYENVKRYFANRKFASYNSGGYDSDFSDQIVDSKQPAVWILPEPVAAP